jgi:hypothetical protein
MEPPASPVDEESGAKRTFACSLAWPGLARQGKSEEAALATLRSYVPRYAPVAARGGLGFDLVDEQAWKVVERVPTRSGGADFGVPTTVLESDETPVSADEARHTAAVLAAAWELFDEVAAAAPPSLRKGPRGGGRDRDAVVAHVAAAEQMFGGKVGVKLPVPAPGDSEAVAANRAALLSWCRSGDATPTARAGWPPRYAARRLIWHVLDHLWEIEDRRERDGASVSGPRRPGSSVQQWT